MNPSDVVLPINSFIGKTVISLSSGNKLGEVREVYFEPTDGFVTTLTLTGSDVDDAETSYLEYSHIHSFGHDAIMADDDGSVLRAAAASLSDKPELRQMLGAHVITENGNSLGQIANIYVTLSSPPFVIYEVRESLLDKLLGREMFIPGSTGRALSADRKRLVVSNEATELAAGTVTDLLERKVIIDGISSVSGPADPDKTVVVMRGEVDDETVVRLRDDDETVVHSQDDDETVVRLRRRAR